MNLVSSYLLGLILGMLWGANAMWLNLYMGGYICQ